MSTDGLDRGVFDCAAATAVLAANFAPWVLALGLAVERVEASGVVLRLPFDARLCRSGGTVSGQALLAAADTAMVLAVAAANGAYRPMTTVGQSMSFQKPVTAKDVLVEARVQRLGRALAFGEVYCRIDGDGGLAAHATSTYALL